MNKKSTKDQTIQTDSDVLYDKTLKIVENFDFIEKNWADRELSNFYWKAICIISISSQFITFGALIYYSRK